MIKRLVRIIIPIFYNKIEASLLRYSLSRIYKLKVFFIILQIDLIRLDSRYL